MLESLNKFSRIIQLPKPIEIPLFSCDHLNTDIDTNTPNKPQYQLTLQNQTSASDNLKDLGDLDINTLLSYNLPLENSDTHDTDTTM